MQGMIRNLTIKRGTATTLQFSFEVDPKTNEPSVNTNNLTISLLDKESKVAHRVAPDSEKFKVEVLRGEIELTPNDFGFEMYIPKEFFNDFKLNEIYYEISNDYAIIVNGYITIIGLKRVGADGFFLTSLQYANEQFDNAVGTFKLGVNIVKEVIVDFDFKQPLTDAARMVSPTVSAVLRNIRVEHTQPLTEAASMLIPTVSTILKKIRIEHTQPLTEAAKMSSVTVSAKLRKQVIDTTVLPDRANAIFSIGVNIV